MGHISIQRTTKDVKEMSTINNRKRLFLAPGRDRWITSQSTREHSALVNGSGALGHWKIFFCRLARHSSHFNDLSIKIPIFSVHNKSVVTRVTIKRPIERPVVHQFAFQVVCCLAPHFSLEWTKSPRMHTHAHTGTWANNIQRHTYGTMRIASDP